MWIVFLFVSLAYREHRLRESNKTDQVRIGFSLFPPGRGKLDLVDWNKQQTHITALIFFIYPFLPFKSLGFGHVFGRSHLCSPWLHLFDQKYSKNSIIVKLKTVFYFSICYNVIYVCDGKADFSASFLQPLVSHDPSEIILILYDDLVLRNLFLLSMLKTVLLLNIFVETMIHYLAEFLVQSSSSKEQQLFEKLINALFA